MKTAALLEEKGKKYFKIGIDEPGIKLKLRGFNGFRRIGLMYYYLPYTEETIDFLNTNGFEFNGAFRSVLKKQYEKRNPIKKIPKYKKKDLELKPFQLEGVNFIEYTNGLTLVADEMGLGKTVQALAWVQIRTDVKKVLITCPSSLKINWKEESKKWVTRKLKVQILEGITPYNITGDIVIINYDVLNAWIIELKLTNFDAVIADEFHYCKNSTSLRTKAFSEITKTIPYRIGLTGTPIESDPMEIYYLVNLLNKNIFPNYIKFIQRYCDAKYVEQEVRGGTYVMLENGRSEWRQNTRKMWKKGNFVNQAELHRILKDTVMIRRTKDQVDLQLPPKVYSNLHFKIDNHKEYRKAELDFIEYIKTSFDAKLQKQLEESLIELDESEIGMVTHEVKKAKNDKLDSISRAPALAKLNELKMLATKGKMKQVIDWVHDFMESDEKLILFAINKVVITQLMKSFPNSVKIDGSTPMKKRNENVKRFQLDDKCRLIILNMKAGGVGLTLTASSNVGILQFPWNPGQVLQAEDRAHRITQKRTVTIYKFVAKDTIEDRIIKLLNYKQIEIDKIIDGKNTGVKQDLVKLLIDSYK